MGFKKNLEVAESVSFDRGRKRIIQQQDRQQEEEKEDKMKRGK